MSSTSSTTSASSNFDAIFNAALAKYANQTGHGLRNHPLASKIDACNSAESILAVFREQAQKFDEFRNGDHRLIKWIQPFVINLHTLSTNPALTTALSLVSATKIISYLTALCNVVVVQAFPPASPVLYAIGVLLSVRILPYPTR